MDSVRILGRRVALIAKILKVGLANLTEPIEGAILTGFSNQKELDHKIEKFIHRKKIYKKLMFKEKKSFYCGNNTITLLYGPIVLQCFWLPKLRYSFPLLE